MNKVHKTIWSQFLGQWVVGSELAKGKSKSKSSGNKKPMLAISAAVALTAPVTGWGACTISGASFSGTGCVDSDVFITNANATIVTGSGVGHAIGIGNAGSPTTVIFNGNNTIHVVDHPTATPGAAVGSGVGIDSSSGANVTIASGITTIVLGQKQGDTGFILNPGVPTSTANNSFTVNAGATFNLYNNSNWRNIESDGLEINGSGKITVTHSGVGKIETYAGNAILLRQNGTAEGINVNLQGANGKNSIVLETHNNSQSPLLTPGNHGISAAIGNAGNTTGKIDIKTDAQITTHGKDSYGIFAQAAGGTSGSDNIKINNAGDITTNNLGAAGIVASGNKGGIVIENSGDIKTQVALGSSSTSRADGIYAINNDGDSKIKNSGTVITQGDDSAGLRAEQAATSTQGNVTIETDASSDITTNGLGAEGIHANIGSERNGSLSASSGNVTVNAQGNIKTSGGGGAEGIYAAITKGAFDTTGSLGSYSTGDIDVTFSGDTIDTTGVGANRGIYVRQDGTGDVNVTHSGTMIKTAGDGAAGILVTKNNAGNLGTSSIASAGVSTVKVTGGNITTQGSGSSAIVQTESGNGKLSVDNTNDVLSTTGNNSSGMHLDVNNGGTASGGIDVKTQGSQINTTGLDSHGIYAKTNAKSGDININLTNTTIDLKGDNSDGISAFNTNTGASNLNINITTNGGSIKTDFSTPTTSPKAGYNYGIIASQQGEAAGHINITNNGTSIKTGSLPVSTGGAPNSDAIYAAITNNSTTGSNATGNITVTNHGTLETNGDLSNGIFTNNKGDGVTTVNNHNVIHVLGAGSRGISSTSSGKDITITNTANITSEGRSAGTAKWKHAADGIYASSAPTSAYNGTDSGAVVVNDMNHSTIEASRFGIQATGGSAQIDSNSEITLRYDSTVAENMFGVDAHAGNSAGNAVVTYDGTSGNGISLTSSTNGPGMGLIGIRATTDTGQSAATPTTGVASVTAEGNINVQLVNSGALSLIYGIEAVNFGQGNAILHYKSGTVDVGVDASSSANYGYGLVAQSIGANGHGSAFLTTDNGTIINTVGDNIFGVHVQSNGSVSGVAAIAQADIDSDITTDGIGSHAVSMIGRGDTNLILDNKGKLTTQKDSSSAVHAVSQQGQISITNKAGIEVQGNTGSGISASSQQGQISIANTAGIEVQGNTGNGISASSQQGQISIANTAGIEVQGNTGSGISASSQQGQISIANTADIEVQGDVGNGILANSQNGGAILINNATGRVVVGKAGNVGSAIGITARADNGGDATVVSVGDITALGNASSIGIEAQASTGLATVQFGQGEITGSGSGIAVASNGQSTGVSTVLLDKNGVISTDGFGVSSQSFGGNTLVTDETSVLRGGSGVQLGAQDSGAVNQFEHLGLIDTLSDLAINENSAAGAQTNINNYGTIYGYIDASASAGDITFTNYSSNSWNIRNYHDSDGDGVKDTKAVAVSDFGAGHKEVINTATGTVRLAVVDDNVNTDTTGEYKPRLTSTPSTSKEGIVQGHLLNLDVFRNTGTIDMTENNLPGDVLVVSGGTTPGANGGGVYISDNGVLKLNTTINVGGIFSESDVLVVDNVQVDSGPTVIDISPSSWSTRGKTIGDGIKLVEVQGVSSPFAFALSQPITAGAFDYYLGQGTFDQSWYLKNEYTAAVGGHLSNQHAAATMFNMNINDRRDNVRDSDSTLWVRMNHTDLSAKLLDKKQSSDIQTTLIQVGADVFKKDSIVAGVFAGYGNSRSSIETRSGLSSATGKVDGYQVGAYASWLPQENKGPYVDLWGSYAWYKNKLDSSRHFRGEDKYDSKGWSLSAEAGYSFAVKELSDGKTWIVQPHAQVIYSRISTDDFVSKLGTTADYSRFHSGKSSGVLTRLGARTYWTLPEGDKGLSPFAELNWLHNGIDNKVKIDYDGVSSKLGKNVIELKLGAEGQVTDKMSVWGHIGGQHGSGDYTRYEIQLGLGWHWK